MPEIGFGTYLTPDGDVCAESVKIAIECGYRQIDTAEFYQNEIWKSPLHIVTNILTDVLEEEYQGRYKENNIDIYPREYFYPFNHDEEFTEACIKKDTYAIHWWGKSWKKNPKVHFLKYKHLPWWKKYLKP